MTTPLFHIVLVEPEIPHNTGNIGRTCVAMNSHLHVVQPASFSFDEKDVRRAGLDYWQHLSLTQHGSFPEWEKSIEPQRCFFFTTKSQRVIYDVQWQPGDTMVFGSETRGLAAPILEKYSTQLVTLPMLGPTRSLNLSNAVAIAIYEGYRQVRAGNFLPSP